MVSGPVFQAGGLASGLDTQGIIDALVGIESVRVQRLEQKKLDYTTQLTSLTEVIVKSQDLRRSLDTLQEAGVPRKISSSHTQITPSVTGEALDGEYQVQVTQLARAAKARSAGTFSSATDVMKEGTLTLNMKGSDFAIDIADGDTLADVAAAINDSAAPVTASVLFDGSAYVLSLSANSTGHTIGDAPSTALTITESYTGVTGAELGLAITQTAQNATVVVDGLSFERQTNTISDAIPGVELSLAEVGATAETLLIGRDSDTTVEQVQAFVDSYNALQVFLRTQTRVSPGTDTSDMLTRDSIVKAYAREVDNIMSTTSMGSGKLTSLVDLGIERDRSGMLVLDEGKLRSAMDANPADVSAFFSGEDGFAAQAKRMVNNYASVGGGALYRRQDDITSSISDLTDDQIKIQDNIERFRARLIRQFSAMELAVGRYNAIGDYLASQEARATKR